MKKTEFNNHPVWATLAGITKTVDDLYASADTSERTYFDRIRRLVAFSKSVRPLGAHHSDRFNPTLLDNLNSSWSNTVSQLANRVNVNSSSYTEQAALYAEQSLTALYGLWTPTTSASQQAQQKAVYDALVETAEGDVARLRQESDSLAARLEELKNTAKDDYETTSEQLEGVREAATETRQVIDGFEDQIQEIIASGTKRIADLTTENTKSYMEWREQQAERFDEDFTPFTVKIQERLDSAEEALEKLRATEKDYTNLTAAAAANLLAQNFMEEAKTSRRTGLWLYGAGFFLLCLAAFPLALLLFGSPAHTDNDTSLWATFSIRAAIGVLTASAATVAIRLGSRFIDNGQQSKRTELELRAFGPFLANVDKTDSDTARLEFVDRAFGTKPSVPDHAEDAIPISAFSQILSAVTKLIGR